MATTEPSVAAATTPRAEGKSATEVAASTISSPARVIRTNDVVDFDPVTQSLAPSHILPDGRFVYLPPPTNRDRIRFFERSVARHGLLQGDLDRSKKEEQAKEGDDESEEKDQQIKVHPLAVASAKLQSGINELNRAINLSTLVSTGEYFGMSNIVDPSLEIPSASAATSSPDKAAADNNSTSEEGISNASTSAAAAAAVAAAAKPAAAEVQQEQRVKSQFVLKRKRVQFAQAANRLGTHRRRLAAALVAQTQPDERLRQLRPHWRLVAPEHGTRARPHATRPTEVIACDVDVYDNVSRVATKNNMGGGSSMVLGRLASGVPRYATMELKEDYKVDKDLEKWERTHFADDLEKDSASSDDAKEVEMEEGAKEDAMEVDKEEGTKEVSNGDGSDKKDEIWTQAEPFALADPSLGKLDANFDPNKVTMLSLRFDIEKSSTGFCQGACLEPISTIAVSEKDSKYHEDEKVLVALQHSLFCAKLFESIRRELAPDTEQVGQVRASTVAQTGVWLLGEAEENFLPPPTMMSGNRNNGLTSLCVVHCHEGEVKVQLDCEYALRVKLVEAASGCGTTLTSSPRNGAVTESATVTNSGSQSAAQLLVLCRTLLLHAQEVYHNHSMKEEEKQRKAASEKTTSVHARKVDKMYSSPHILQSAVSLGSKILFERRIRKVLMNVNQWLGSQTTSNGEGLQVDWLSLSVFDFSSHFTLSFRSWMVDAHLACDELTVTRFLDDGTYRKAKFYSDAEFELYLTMALRRVLRRS